MALAKDTPYEVQGQSELLRVLLTPSITYYKGCILALTAAGGLAIKQTDVAAQGGTAGVLTEGVVVGATSVYASIERGRVWIPFASAAQANVGDYVYATDDGTISMSATNSDPIGKVIDVRVGVASLVDFRCGLPKTALA
jgi:hypothetical protein